MINEKDFDEDKFKKELEDCEDEIVDNFKTMCEKYGSENATINIAKVTLMVLDEMANKPKFRPVFDMIMTQWSLLLMKDLTNIDQPEQEDRDKINEFKDDLRDIYGGEDDE